MVPKEALVCAQDASEAGRLLAENPGFDVIPILKDGRLNAFLERTERQPTGIWLRHVISDGTNILNLVEILSERRFGFVLVGSAVAGYIHFSDLNKPFVKLPFYVLTEAVEQWMVE